MNKFTQEVKDDWLKALKSGKYIQARGNLYNSVQEPEYNKKGHCCIGVLGVIHPKLSNEGNYKKDPYNFLNSTIGVKKTADLYLINDRSYDFNKSDYSNVIPFIEKLEVTL